MTQRDRDYHLARMAAERAAAAAATCDIARLIHHELAQLHADRVFSTIEGALPDPASHTGRLQGAVADVSLIDR